MRPIRSATKTPLSGKKTAPPTKPKPIVNNKDKEPVQVFCRLRPLSTCNGLVAIRRNSDNLIELKCPTQTQTKSSLYYKFKYVFDENASQTHVFDSVAQPLVKDLFNGRNGLLFTYGVTSSGKTYTVVGNAQNSGILPRCLDAIFNTISSVQVRKYVFRPDGQNYFTIQSTPDALLQWQNERNNPQTPSTPAVQSKTPKSSRKRENCDENNWEKRVKDETIIDDINCDNNYAVFVSYAEIYNNYIYDLLDDSLDSLKMSRQPQSKVLHTDSRRRVYVYGGTEIEVKTAEEAFELFIKGVRRRRMAHTNLNTESSRSHSVFTIRLVQAPLDASSTEVIQDDRLLTVSQLSLVDLAGSERTNRTQNTGERAREAGNINNSLMALRICIDTLRENQRNGTNKEVPYRNNKLTHLFKSYFEGEGKVKMIICVNPSADDYDETLHVMKFAEHSQDVLVNSGANPFFRFNLRETVPKYNEFIFTGIDMNIMNMFGPALPNAFLQSPDDEKILPEWLECIENRRVNKELKFEKLKKCQLEFRQRLAEIDREDLILKQQINIMQMDLDARESQIKTYENKCCQNERLLETQSRKISELERKSNSLENELEEKHRLFSQLELEKERMKSKMREKLDSERERLKNIFERLLAEKQAQLEKEQCVSKEKMHLVKEILNADNTNWEFVKENRESLYPITNTASGDAIVSVPSNGIDSQASTQTPNQILKRKSEYDLPPYGTPNTNKSSTPQTVNSNVVDNASSHNPPPVINPRHRRSLSSGNEKWIDHRPPGTLDLGTVLRPKIKNKKSVSNLKAVNILKDASKYALTHHEADHRGHVETHVYKGEVIPSSSGGAQVIFNDVETLKQSSPPIRKRTVSDTRLMSPPLESNQVMIEAELHPPVINLSKRSRR